jgi:hypothetical protein
MFPVDDRGRERIGQMNVWKSRFMGSLNGLVSPVTGPQQVSYDGGAWTGWKDDLPEDSALAGVVTFGTRYMPFGIGPVQGPTADIYMHLVLVNERRNIPL